MTSSGSQAKKAWSFIRDQPRGASFAVVRRHSFRHEMPRPCLEPPSRVHLFVPCKPGHIGRAPGIVHFHPTDDFRGLEHGRPSMEFEGAIFNRHAFHKLKEKEATRRKEGPSRPMTADKGTASSGQDAPQDAPADGGCDPGGNSSTMPDKPSVDGKGGGPDN
ncbi:unnamed protein product [Symbiodinium sp. CCMP2456]|nr:unnamed protein product [Symbiodinium sp. CCMP2456]